MTDSWKSFWIGTGAAIIITIAAGFILQTYNLTSSEAYSTSNTRL